MSVLRVLSGEDWTSVLVARVKWAKVKIWGKRRRDNWRLTRFLPLSTKTTKSSARTFYWVQEALIEETWRWRRKGCSLRNLISTWNPERSRQLQLVVGLSPALSDQLLLDSQRAIFKAGRCYETKRTPYRSEGLRVPLLPSIA